MPNVEKVERPEKHIVITESIGGLRGAIDRLNDLVCKARNGSLPDTDKEEEKMTEPTLLSTLDNTPGELREEASRIDKCVGELQEILF